MQKPKENSWQGCQEHIQLSGPPCPPCPSSLCTAQPPCTTSLAGELCSSNLNTSAQPFGRKQESHMGPFQCQSKVPSLC